MTESTANAQAKQAGAKSSFVARLTAWLHTPAAPYWILLAILLVAAYLRLSHLNWDQGTHIHPDERFLTMVSSAMQLPSGLGEFFDSTRSLMSPYNLDFGFFVYGTLPLFIVRVIAEFAQKFNQGAELWHAAPGILLTMNGYDGIHLVGRALSGLFDLACVLLVFVLGRRLYSVKVGLLAAALYTFAVLPLQQAHFYTVDTFGTFFALLTFYFAVRVAQGGEPGRHGGGWGTYVALGASLGASVASRINLAPLAGIALLAAGIRAWDDFKRVQADSRSGDGRLLSTLLQATLFSLLVMGLVTVAVFRVAQPYAFGGTTLLDFAFADKWRDNMRSIQQLISGAADYPPGHQWANRTPFVFPFVNMVYWGLGLPLGVTAWTGWAVALLQVLRGLTRIDKVARRQGDTLNRADVARSSDHYVPVSPLQQVTRAPWRNHILPVVWIGGMFLWQGLQYVQSMRYLLPIYPLLALMAAWFLWWLVDNARVAGAKPKVPGSSLQPSTFNLRRLAVPAAYALLAGVTILTMLWGWGFLAIYRRPLSRVTASKWIYANVPAGSVIANEHWDDGLPFSIDGRMSFKPSGEYYGLRSSSDGQMQMYGEDTPEKREQLYQWLNEADYIAQSSNRLWGSIPRLPMRYPMSTGFYKLLAEGKLGFELAGRFTSFPTIFGIQFDDTWAEEAFSVYDHPEVRIYRKTPAYSEALVRSYLDKIDLENTIMMWPKQVSQAPTALLLSDAEAARQQAGGTWSQMFDANAPQNRSPVLSVVLWLLAVELLGLIAFPLAFFALRGLADRGYGVSKTLGLLLLAWLSWIGPSLKLVPYQRGWILLCLGLLIVVSGVVAWFRRRELARYVREHAALLLTEEAIFLVLFGLFLLIRIGNPDLWHPARGGEKPMEFAYLNAIIRSTTFPPYDPWHAGGFMNYYYFGWVIIGTLIKLTGIVPWVAYNLAVPTLFALTGTGAFAVAFSLADGDRATEFPGEEAPYRGLRIGSLLAGLAAVFFVTIIGNLGNAKLLFAQIAQRSTAAVAGTGVAAGLLNFLSGTVAVITGKASLQFPNDWWFWNASRIIPDTINEFPFFTFTYADLHAHMIALPLTLLALAAAVALVRNVGVGGRGLGVRDTSPATDSKSLTPSTQSLAPDPEPSPWRIPLADLLPILLLGFVLGALRATNTWDFPTYTLAGLAALIVMEAVRRSRMGWPTVGEDGSPLQARLAFLFRAVVSVIWRALILVGVASVAFYPYTKYYATAYAGIEKYKEARTGIPDFLIVHGFFLLLAVIWLAGEIYEQLRSRERPEWLAALLPWIAAAGLVLIGAGWVLHIRTWLIALPLFILAVVLALGRDLPPTRRFALLLFALALAIVMGVELIRQKDDIGRMNTVFKFYLQAWTLFGVTTAYGLATWASRALSWRPGWRRLAWALTGILFVLVMLYPAFAARAKVKDRFSAEASPLGLDGIAYMDKAIQIENGVDVRLADDKAAMHWLLQNVQGSPVILEAQIPEYRWGSRFSIYTGLPTVQGWNWHQRQQRSVVPSIVVERRVNDVQEIYSTLDPLRAHSLIDRYGVRYIVVGGLERAYYAPEGLAKFDTLVQQGLLKIAYQGGAVTIYEVAGHDVSALPAVPAAQPAPTESPLPTPAAFESPLE
jgi:YYY domain-containing protein